MADRGHIELEWAVNAIRVGARHRKDLGDLEPLATSIAQLGLLQPITIAPDGTLICGARRLAAVKLLGHATVAVWVRTGLSDRLRRLLAEQHDNVHRQPLQPIEAASLYAELKEVLSEQADARKRASQFGGADSGIPGGADSAPPGWAGRSRREAARLVTGGAGYTRLEQITRLQELAEGDDDLADRARAALDAIAKTGKVNGHYQAAINPPDPDTDLTDDQPDDRETSAPDREPTPHEGRVSAERRRRQRRLLLQAAADLADWTSRVDPGELATELDANDWDTLTGHHATIATFMDAAAAVRTSAGAA